MLDLFCGAGGCSVGYARAGFDVVGVDINPQPHYPFEFYRADAMAVLKSTRSWFHSRYDAIHASPPCKVHNILGRNLGYADRHDDLIAPTRALLTATGLPWVIENVPGAPIRPDYLLCGYMFGLRTETRQLVRERWFETSWRGFELRPACHHTGPAVTVTGGGAVHGHATRNANADVRREAMSIDWMTRDELSQAIPPPYTEYVGLQLLKVLEVAA
jgi:DNA (cytosine-5)-methyltransferase 1